ncbi:MAG: T9SS type A sorting domain-containing protein [Bacteroidia bacterium]
MKTKIYLPVVCIGCLLQITNIQAQSFILYGDKTFGGDQLEMSQNILYDGNDNFIIGGFSATNINGDKTDSLCDPAFEDIWILKIDTAFNIIWQNSMGGESFDLFPRMSFLTGQEAIVFSNSADSDSASCDKSENNRGSRDYWVCLVDSSGNKLWDKTLGGFDQDHGPCIVQLSTGKYIVSGSSNSTIGGDKTVLNNGSSDFWTLKLDSLGNKLWDKVYGGTDQEMEGSNDEFSVLACSGDDFILAGVTLSPISGDVSDSSRGLEDIWIIKCDSSGNKKWDRRFGGSSNDRPAHIINTIDNGFILCGNTSSPQDGDVSEPPRGSADWWVIKMDSLGNKQWDRRYGGNQWDRSYFIKEVAGEGYWICGGTSSDSSFEVSEPTYGFGDFWMLKIDSVGNKLWDKRFGANGTDMLINFVILPDTSIVLCGYADSGASAVKTDVGKGGYDYWLVHFKYGYNTVSVNELTNPNNSVTVFPNPAQDIINITSTQNFTADLFVLYDATGRKVIEQKINKTATVNVSQLRQGIYFYEVRDREGRKVYGKLIKR